MSENISGKTDVNKLGEFGLIDHLTSEFSTNNPSTIKGIGDDAAVIDHGDHVSVISTDMLAEGIHFDLMYTPLKHLGYKSIVVNLSDIYAMNATPQQVTMSIAISSKYTVEALEELYAGVLQACKDYGVDLIGGDTTSSPKGMTISVTAIGKADPKDVVFRSGAKPGDILCVTGNLGAAYLGLQILEREKQLYLSNPGIQPDLENQDFIIGRQLKPTAQKAAVDYFKAKKFKPTSMIDVSDGLASDLFHICKQSGVGAFVEEGKVPLHPDTEKTALQFNLDPITCALNGGEDYELLFTVDEKNLEEVKYMPGVFIIGEIIPAQDGIKLHTTGGNIHDLKAQGWNHFNEEDKSNSN